MSVVVGMGPGLGRWLSVERACFVNLELGSDPQGSSGHL